MLELHSSATGKTRSGLSLTLMPTTEITTLELSTDCYLTYKACTNPSFTTWKYPWLHFGVFWTKPSPKQLSIHHLSARHIQHQSPCSTSSSLRWPTNEPRRLSHLIICRLIRCTCIQSTRTWPAVTVNAVEMELHVRGHVKIWGSYWRLREENSGCHAWCRKWVWEALKQKWVRDVV